MFQMYYKYVTKIKKVIETDEKIEKLIISKSKTMERHACMLNCFADFSALCCF